MDGKLETQATLAAGSGLDDTVAGSGQPSGVEATLASGSPPSPAAPQRADGLAEVSPGLYEVDKELSRGGMGRILIARDRRIGRTVALKELLGKGDALAKRFKSS